ncbi:ASCH domain-containing protein [Glutamicibacter nicotianae]|uniref:ASCH domain-containing protein n=1 Tax=Glutamicibacter nicotianae TaxID=37929 RepID=UPI00167FC8EB|nr:ASCH domain-containing protein [Glutamicibacter nicotianae]
MDNKPTSTLPAPDNAAAAAMWHTYCTATGRDEVEPYVVDYFGDHPALADELLGLVREGTKRATASLENEYAQSGEPLPEPDGHWIACDSTGAPALVLRTTEVRQAAFDEVDEDFAHAEGEDERTMAGWRREHEKYWRRTQAAAGHAWQPDDTRRPGHHVVLERFEVAWPRPCRTQP